MRNPPAALFAATVLLVLTAAPALAAPEAVSVRIEGRAETIFEGPVLTDGRNVRALSDGAAPGWGRRCDGLNLGANPSPGPTPTAAGADAMAILGEGFDADWYPSFDDYFLTQWGPERQDLLEGEYWGIAVNNVFSSVGGCQHRLDAGDEVLWIYDAFESRPQLVLYPASYAGGAVQLTAEATLGQPFEVSVVQWGHECCSGAPPPAPTRGTAPFAGAEVGPVVSTGRGFERVDTASGETVETGSDGTAEIVFEEPGWHRIKATRVSGGAETVIRSNRIDVCVPAAGASGCGAAPAEDLVRTPPPSGLPEEPGPGGPGPGPGGPGEPDDPDPGPGPQPGPSPGGASATSPPPPAPADADPVRVAKRGLDRGRIAAGVVGVSWRVRDAGAGVSRWTVSAKRLGRGNARFVTRARGRAARSSARLRLPRGARYRLRLTVTDALGRSSHVNLGTVRVPA